MDERAALEARFAASNTDYREAKAIVRRALTISLVSGLFTLAFVGIRLVVEASSDSDAMEPSWTALPIHQVCVGAALVASFFTGKRFPAASVGAAAAVWLAALAVPFAIAPALALLSMASATGVVLTLARIGILIALAQGIPSALRMKRLFAGGPG